MTLMNSTNHRTGLKTGYTILLVIVVLAVAGINPRSVVAQTSVAPEFGYDAANRYSATGADQLFTVPANVTEIQVKVWGAAGMINDPQNRANNNSGPGGYVEGFLQVNPGDVFSLVVGEKGTASNSPYGFGGTNNAAGSGGGLSGVFTGSAVVQATDTARAVLVAGGGGGSDYAAPIASLYDNAGGGGGDPAASGGEATMQGANGTALNQAGGGGGYSGGSLHQRQTPTSTGFAGNGGSNYVDASVSYSRNLFSPELDWNAQNTNDPHYVVRIGQGQESTGGINGDGMIVIQWKVQTPATAGSPNAVTPEADYCSADQFKYSGQDNLFTVPAGVTTMKVKMWGGGGMSDLQRQNQTAGSGGYVEAIVNVVPGTDYVVMVGARGADGNTTGYSFGGKPGGPAGPGGGLSGLFTGNMCVAETDMARAVMIAGGGGGADSTIPLNSSGYTTRGQSGGQGGDPVNGGGQPTMRGIDGALIVGTEDGYHPPAVAGGGGGYSGGVNHRRFLATSPNNAGEGGTNYIDLAAIVGGSDVNLYTPEWSEVPPNKTDVHWIANVGQGQNGAGPGNHGLVVIQYTSTADDPDNDGVCGSAPGNLEIEKTGSAAAGADSIVNAGDTITYSMVVTNNGPVDVNNITVSDPLGGGLTVVCPTSGNATIATLIPTGSETCTATYIITAADVTAGTITNQATAAGTDAGGSPVTDLSDDPTDPTDTDTDTDGDFEDPTVLDVRAGNLDVEKTGVAAPGADGIVNAGDTITYSFVVTNNGPIDVNNITVSDPLAGGLTVVCPTSGNATIATLIPTGTETCTATYVITGADVTAGSITNQATAAGTDSNGNPVNDASDDPTDTTNADTDSDGDFEDPTVFDLRVGNLDIEKSGVAAPGADSIVNAGDTITYSMVVTNNGPITVNNITVSDPLGGGLTVVCPTSGNATIATLIPTGTETCTAAYVITGADVTTGTITNQATAAGTDSNGNPVTDASDDPTDTANADTDADGDYEDPTVIDVRFGNIDLEKSGFVNTGADGIVNAGDVITYSMVVTNNGPIDVNNITVSDPLGGGLTVVCPTSGNATIATLIPTATETCTADYVLTQTDVDAGSVTNQATAAGTDANGNPVEDVSDDPADATNADTDTDGDFEDPTITTFFPPTNLDLTKVGTLNVGADGVLGVGDSIDYTITVTNNGAVTVFSTVVTDSLGIAVTCLTGNPIPVLAVGANDTCTASYVITAADLAAGEVENTATGAGEDPSGGPVTDDSDDPADPTDNDPDNDGDGEDPTIIPLILDPDLDLTKTGIPDTGGDGVMDVGDLINYTITVTNTGNVNLTAVGVTDSLGISVTCPGGNPIPTLTVGQAVVCTASYPVTATDLANGSVINTATGSGTDPSGAPVTDDSDDPTNTTDADPDGDGNPDDPTETPLASSPSLNLTKSGSINPGADGVVAAGDSIVYTIVVTNDGNVPLNNVTVTDSLGIAVNCPSGNPIPVLAVNASETCSATYVLTATDISTGSVVNTATGAGTDPTGTPVQDDSDDPTDTTDSDPDGDGNPDDPTVTELQPMGNLDLVKTGLPVPGADGLVNLGDTINYTIEVNNNGPIPVVNTTVTDSLGIAVTCPVGNPIPYLSSGGSEICTASYVITATDVAAGQIVNTATAVGTDSSGNTVTDDSDDPTDPTDVDSDGDGDGEDPTVINLIEPNLDIEKTGVLTIASTIAQAGDPIDYTLVVTNNGNTDLINTQVSDSLGIPVSCPSGNPIPLLVVGGSETCTATYLITTADIVAGGVTNTATGTGTDTFGNPVTDASDDPADTTETDTDSDGDAEDPTFIPLVPVYDLSIQVLLDPLQPLWVTQGQTVNYDIIVTNEGNLPTLAFTVINTIPAGLSFSAASGPGFICAGNTPAVGQVQCDYILSIAPDLACGANMPCGLDSSTTVQTAAQLAPLQNAQIDLELNVDDLTQAPYNNQVEIDSDGSGSYGLTDNDSTPGSNTGNDPGPGAGTPAEAEDDTSSVLVRAAASTPITLKVFRSTQDNGLLTIDWFTSMEDGNQGFLIYGREADGDWTALTDHMVPTRAANDDGTAYRHQITTDRNWTELTLTDVDLYGSEVVHGPFGVGKRYGDIDSHGNAANRRSNSESDTLETAHPFSESRYFSDRDLYLDIKKEGVHRVTYRSLLKAGVDFRTTRVNELALTHRGEAVPIRVKTNNNGNFGNGSWIEFVAEPIDSLYVDANTYRLSLDATNAKRIRAVREVVSRPVRNSATNVHEWAPDVQYSRVAPGKDPWFALKLSAINEPLKRTLKFAMKDLDVNAEASIELDLWAAADNPKIRGDHHLRLWVNDRLVGRRVFDGVGEANLVATLPPGTLVSGTNEVTLELPLNRGSRVDTIVVDAVRILHGRRLLSSQKQIKVTSAGTESYRARGFPDRNVGVYRMSTDGSVVRVLTPLRRLESGYSLRFGAADENAHYYVANATNRMTPELRRVPVFTPITDGAAEYVVIANRRFITNDLRRLVQTRESEGLTSRIVDVDHLYAEYSGGIVDPGAIKRFIADAREKLGTHTVLLVGGDSYDYKKNLVRRGIDARTFAKSFIPSIYASTGQTVQHAPVDPLYGDIDDDGVPEVVIGRLPVQTRSELRTLVGKILNYAVVNTEQKAVFVADRIDDGTRRSFSTISNAIRTRLPEWDVKLLNQDATDPRILRNRFRTLINDGQALAVYFGHSDTNSWGFDGLVRRSDINQLVNDANPTAVMQFGCWNTYYVAPRANTLAHKWLVKGDHGAAIVMGSVTLTEAGSERVFASLIIDRVAAGMSYGEAVNGAKRVLVERFGIESVRDLINGFIILGDPAMKPPVRQ